MREAVTRVSAVAGVAVVRGSRFYATAPVGGPPQPPFLNAAILVHCTLSPPALLDALLRIEVALGRVRGAREVRFGPRTIDLDILWIEGVVVHAPHLTVPHPRLTERAFAMLPLLDVVPDATDPCTSSAFAVPNAPGVGVTSSTW